MQNHTPISIITGPLGSGKTTLLRHLLSNLDRKLAIVMNEFGELAIDSKVIEGKNVRMTELGGGCVCCSLVGEFEAAVNEIIDSIAPEQIVLETTGVAEPGALVFDIEENLPRVRLDGVISIMDADGLVRFPAIGHTLRVQLEEADLIVLNKIDLVSPKILESLREKLRVINPDAVLVQALRCQVDVDLLFGLGHKSSLEPPPHRHQPEVQSVSFRARGSIDRKCFEHFLEGLGLEVYRAKGFICLNGKNYLFNYVRGRWELEPFAHAGNELVFIGPQLERQREALLNRLHGCLEDRSESE